MEEIKASQQIERGQAQLETAHASRLQALERPNGEDNGTPPAVSDEMFAHRRASSQVHYLNGIFCTV